MVCAGCAPNPCVVVVAVDVVVAVAVAVVVVACQWWVVVGVGSKAEQRGLRRAGTLSLSLSIRTRYACMCV